MAGVSRVGWRLWPSLAAQVGRLGLRSRSTYRGIQSWRPDGALRAWSGRRANGDWSKRRSTEPPQFTELDKADAWMLRKAHETGFLSWFRNGLLASGIGVIAYVQSDLGREAAYSFFILGGICICFGGASYVANLFALRRTMLLSVKAALLNSLVVFTAALFWLCAISLYIGQLEIETTSEEEEREGCQHCQNEEDSKESKDQKEK
ncbi:transmembrane protein 160 [Erpetoichthys calabaricus]|uniref:Transmembrane protein 160 n=1 Tax=Erpetoichthys calabaricus TaxID=27687 RepID=A0A8C4RBM8_ERPCA|nr:transmembrane protein 160 [Erpetoichthys calabaricus]